MKESPAVNSTDKPQRGELLALLDTVGVGGIKSHPGSAEFILGFCDIPFSDLHVDSLVLMEMGIGLEERYGISLSPNQLSAFTTVGAIWNEIVSRENTDFGG